MACLGAGEKVDARQRYGARLFWLYMGYWVLEAVARENLAWFAPLSPVAALLFAGLFLYLLFVRPAPDGLARSGPLLSPGDLLKSVPRRGLIFILALAVLFGVVHWTGLDERAVVLAGELLRGDMSPWTLFLLTILAVIFLTEVLSNTAVVAAFFTIAFYAAKGHAMDPLPLMIGGGRGLHLRLHDPHRHHLQRPGLRRDARRVADAHARHGAGPQRAGRAAHDRLAGLGPAPDLRAVGRTAPRGVDLESDVTMSIP